MVGGGFERKRVESVGGLRREECAFRLSNEDLFSITDARRLDGFVRKQVLKYIATMFAG